MNELVMGIEKYTEPKQTELPPAYVNSLPVGLPDNILRAARSIGKLCIPPLYTVASGNAIKVPNLRIGCVAKSGHGATTLAETVRRSLSAAIKTSPALKESATVSMLQKNGISSLGMAELSTTTFYVFILDGLPDIQALEPMARAMLMHAMHNGIVIYIDETERQIKEFLGEKVPIIHLEQPSTDSLLKVLDRMGYAREFNKEDLRGWVDKQLHDKRSPKEITRDVMMTALSSTNSVSGNTRNVLEPLVRTSTLESISSFLAGRGKSSTTLEIDYSIDEIYEKLTSRVFGQREQLRQLSLSVYQHRLGLGKKQRPLSLLFLGPTGVGKTETAKALAELIYNSRLIRVDMGEYSEQHSISKLFGAPPGYIGFSTDNYFIKRCRESSSAVILFDEIEKAHENVHNSLLHMIDEGHFTTGAGETIDVSNFVIILTSNSMALELSGLNRSIGFGEVDIKNNVTSDELAQKLARDGHFSPEFVNRLDKIIKYSVLDDDAVLSILHRELDEIRSAIKQEVHFDPSVDRYVLANYKKEFGGRSVLRLVSDIKAAVAVKVSENCGKIVIAATDLPNHGSD